MTTSVETMIVSRPGPLGFATHARPLAAPPSTREDAVETSRFYVPTDICGSLEGSRIAFDWLMRQSKLGQGEPLVVVPTVAHARRNEYLAAATSRTRWTTGPRHLTEGTSDWLGGPTLLVFPDVRVVGWFDRDSRVTSLCVLQGVRGDTTTWAAANRPEDLTTGRPFAGPSARDAVVAEALSVLRWSDARQGLTAPSDVALVVRTLRMLRKAGHHFSAGELEAWALVQGWDPRAAMRLGAYAERVLEDRHIALRAMDRPPRGALNRWRKAAEKAAPHDGATPRPDARNRR